MPVDMNGWRGKTAYTGQGRPVKVADIKMKWNHGKPALCAAYDVSALIDALPAGKEVKVAVGRDLDELGGVYKLFAEHLQVDGFIHKMSQFAGATRVPSGTEAMKLLEDASHHGKTPLKSVLFVGHSGPGQRSIGGTIVEEKIFDADSRFSLKEDMANAWQRPSFEDATARNLPPAFWFKSNAEVRFLGCYTASIAEFFAQGFLREGAVAYGTTRNAAYFDDGSFGFSVGIGRLCRVTLPLFGEVRYHERYKKFGESVHTLKEYYDLSRGVWKDFEGKQ